jgi:DNA-binding NarL/FixJ family response regulator
MNIKDLAAARPNCIRVLLVDDHPSMLWGLERLIAGESPRMMVVGAALNAAQALKLTTELRPDVIVLDLDLGADSGTDLIPEFLARAPSRILVFTGVHDASLRDAAVLAGARGIVGKDEPPASIIHAIQKVHDGELWLDRSSTGRVFVELSRALNGGNKSDEHTKIASLTRREREIVCVVSTQPESSVKGIAHKHHMSEKTLRNHLTSIYDKLGVRSRLELHMYARKHKLDVSGASLREPMRPRVREVAA